MKDTSAFKYLLPYITQISMDKTVGLRSELRDDITTEIQNIYCDIISSAYTAIKSELTIERHTIIISRQMNRSIENLLENPYLKDIKIFFDIYNDVYEFIVKWGLEYEHYELLYNLRQLQISLKSKIYNA